MGMRLIGGVVDEAARAAGRTPAAEPLRERATENKTAEPMIMGVRRHVQTGGIDSFRLRQPADLPAAQDAPDEVAVAESRAHGAGARSGSGES